MFKFSKQVDQAQQGLEEGEISDDDLQVPQRTIPLPPQTKTKHIPHVNQQQQESAEYVIEQVKIKPPSPIPDRKKDRKEIRVEDKNQRYDKNSKVSPDNPIYLPPPVMQPIQPMQPVNPYYQYPPNMYAFHQPINDQRQTHYPPVNQPPSQMMMPPYQQNPYQQRAPGQGHWNTQMGLSPNKSKMQNNMGDYGNRHNSYGYNNVQPPSNYQMPNMNYQQQNKYYGGMPISNNLQNGQNYQNTQYSQQQYQQSQIQYQQQQEIYNKNKAELQKRKQEQQELRKREKKVKELQKKISENIMQEEDEGIVKIGEMLQIIKSMVDDQGQDDDNLENLHTKIEESKMRAKIYQILTTMQLPKIIEKLKQKQLERRLIELSKKKQAAEIYRRMNRKDPRIKAL